MRFLSPKMRSGQRPLILTVFYKENLRQGKSLTEHNTAIYFTLLLVGSLPSLRKVGR